MKKPDVTFPSLPGVYIFKDTAGAIIYVGKAKSLKARIASYFQKTNDFKVDTLLSEYHSIDYILTKNEIEALLLEAQMVGQHKPKFNVLLKDGQPFIYLLFTQTAMPELKVVRNKKEKGSYFGPFLHKRQARGVATFLSDTFKLKICNKKIENGCLDFHIGRCAGNCMNIFNKEDYIFRLQLAEQVLKKDHKSFLKSIKEKIAEYNKQLLFEKSAQLAEYARNLETIFETIRTRFSSDRYKDDIFAAATPTNIRQTDNVATSLGEFLGTSAITSIDCFDISHFQSSYIVGSCIRFMGDKPDKNKFRRFKIKTLEQQNDYAALQEIVSRRYKEGNDVPDLIVIDGGKGQRNAIKSLYPQTQCIALAKREETIFSDKFPEGKKLDIQSAAGQTLIAIRDYAHHFAVSYHRLRRKRDASTSSA